MDSNPSSGSAPEQHPAEIKDDDLQVWESVWSVGASQVQSLVESWIPSTYQEAEPLATSTTLYISANTTASGINRNHLRNLLTGGAKNKTLPANAKAGKRAAAEETESKVHGSVSSLHKKKKKGSALDQYLKKK
ncbi:hypothetical protein HDU91_007056 [Kappamyces sp. JEL0680]|nr:hypothetical protein HDU91_007056 [Kappamyces sp. JEL0680]